MIINTKRVPISITRKKKYRIINCAIGEHVSAVALIAFDIKNGHSEIH